MTTCQEVTHGNTTVTAQALGQQSVPGAPELSSHCPRLLQFLSSFKITEERKQDIGSTRSKTPVRGMSAHKPMWQAVLGG